MPKRIFVNLPVEDVTRSIAFYEALGFTVDPQFSNAGGAMLAWSDTIAFMVLSKPVYASFTPKRIIDAKTTSGVLIALSFDSRAEVDAITEAAIAAGGRQLHDPEDLGYMYSRAFEDLDGHGFGPLWMDVEATRAAMPSAADPA